MSFEPLRIGVLGAARITELALIKPAALTNTRLVAVAARNRTRAEEFAERHSIERVSDSYDDVLDDPEVEAVYNPLPNSEHAYWNIRALAAGKHVLTEKPAAANSVEAAAVRRHVEGSGLTFFEGFHYRYHPLFARLHAIIDSGEIGDVVSVETVMDMPAPADSDPRWSLPLAGGALMDLGCYSVHSHRILAGRLGGEPTVVSAEGGERAGAPGIDEWLTAQLLFPNGVTGRATCNMAAGGWQMSHTVAGSRGQAVIPEFVNPHQDDRLLVTTADGTRVERLGNRSSYTYQLEAFTEAVRTGRPAPTDETDSVRTMELIDASYVAAGFQPRTGRVDLAAERT